MLFAGLRLTLQDKPLLSSWQPDHALHLRVVPQDAVIHTDELHFLKARKFLREGSFRNKGAIGAPALPHATRARFCEPAV